MIRNDLYAKYIGIDCRFWEIGENLYMLQTDYNEKLIVDGFKRYNDIELKDKIYKEVILNDIESAFQVSTYCSYKGYKHFIDAILNNGLYRIWPLEEAQIHFKDFARHGYDPVYEVDKKEIEEIWEERTPIEGFKFDTEPIVYLKRRN
ncbi:hypothetical protein [Chryseobacterium limigenitum]|uniref:Uncharacterized protein n=1 Tax=Chryseobacterium limigenitum TaxID=1612149 RepID=A0A1K2IXG9_9FLAO|nr:hypothetical protein [Chryseobacterium limigenitum]SFZ97121.1 hypothetical protein SAMN05216324_1433 [Chryseobacterium limigenitum]